MRRVLNGRLPSSVEGSGASVGPSAAPKTLAETAARWDEYEQLKLPSHEKAPTTHHEHIRIVRRHLLPAFGERPVAEIESGDVFDWYANLTREHRPLARNVKSVLSSILAFARVIRYASRTNPAAEVKSLRRMREPIFAQDVHELAEFRKAIVAYNEDLNRPDPSPSPLFLDAVDMILATGLLLGEVRGLRHGEDIFLGGETPYGAVNGAIKEKGGPKRGPYPKGENSRQEIDLADYAVATILRRMLEDDGTGSVFLFHTKTGKSNGRQDVHRAISRVRE